MSKKRKFKKWKLKRFSENNKTNIWNNSQVVSNKGTQSKISNSDLLKRYWQSWTMIVNWIITEEYNQDLSGIIWLTNYDKMRKSDAQVAASLLVCELPIKSANWFVEAAEDKNWEVTEEAVQIAKFVEKCLFEKMSITWDDFLWEALTMLQFWHSVFEKIYTSDWENVFIKKLWLRKANSITRWGDLEWNPWITQILAEAIQDPKSPNQNKQEVFIPGAKLIIFTNGKQGENYEGISVLRSAYKHWYFKDKLYKFDAVKHERQSVWIPVIYMPSGAWDDDKAAALDLVTNVRASEQSGIVMPGTKEDWWLFEFAEVKWNNWSDLYESIKHHNREIAKNVLAQFLELWDTDSGSRSLWDSQTGLFLQSMESVAKNLSDTLNRYLIPELVDLNFDVENYPKLKFKKMSSVDYNVLSTSLWTLSEKGIITPDDELEQFLRNAMDLPRRVFDWTESRWNKPEEKTSTKEVNNKAKKTTDTDINVATKNNKEKEEVKKEVKAEAKKKEEFSNSCWGDLAGTFYDKEYMELWGLFNNRVILDLQSQVSTKEDLFDLKKKGLKFNAFEREAFRPLTFAEKKVNLVSLKRSMQSFEDLLFEKYETIAKKQKEDLLKQVKKAVQNNDIEAVWRIRTKFSSELAQALTDVQKEMFEIWKKGAALEMNVKVPPTSKEVRGAMRVQNDAITDQIVNQMENETKTAVTTIVNQKGGSITEAGVAETVAAVSAGLDKKIQQAKATLTSLWVTWAVNLWRTSIFECYPEKIYAMQYSAILDENTTNICLSLDGRVVKPGSKEFYQYSPPRHYNCRSIWVEILEEEVFKPKITWIPSNIPAAKTLWTAKEMKSPIVLKWSPAIKIIQDEINQRKGKLTTLKESWKFPNRQKQHETKIKELEKAIDGKFCEYLKEVLIVKWISFWE